MATTADVLVGSAMIFGSIVCLLTNCVVLTTIALNSDFYVHSSYKIMLLMGVFDVSQSIGHFITGIFTVAQYEASYTLYKVVSALFGFITTAFQIIGVMVSPAYECYVFTTILLAFNRYILMCCPWLETQMFSPTANKIWLLICSTVFAGFAGLHVCNKIYSRYLETEYKWTYDPEFEWNEIRQHLIMYYQILGVFVAWLFYIAITISLFRCRNQVASITRFRANRKILIHAFVIIVYSTLMNMLWHKADLLIPIGKTHNFIINMMWIGSAGLSPFLCISINKLLRKRLAAMILTTLPLRLQVTSSVHVPVNQGQKNSVRSSHELA